MERLTKRELIELKDGQKIVACNSKDDECNDYCMHGYCKWNDEALKKLKEYEDLEERGLLIRLPCKVGDDVWTIMCGMTGKHPALFRQEFTLSMFSHFGTAVFLTKEEAEAALERMG